MPDSDCCRIVAFVPRLSGAYVSSTEIVTTAWPSSVMSMSFTDPALVPPTSTRLPLTSWDAFRKRTFTV